MKRSLLFVAGALWTMVLCATPIRFGTWNIRLATMDNWEKENEKDGNRIDHIFLTPGTNVSSYDFLRTTTPQGERL